MELRSILRCPHCFAESAEVMPTDACRYFHTCGACGALLKPRPGDCCVFCSYGSVPCPPRQRERGPSVGDARGRTR
jgi:hypothetical protein